MFSLTSPEVYDLDALLKADAYRKSLIQSYTEKERIVVFGKSKCTITEKIEKLLTDLGLPYHVVRIDSCSESECLPATLASVTQIKAVPLIFINTVCIGGMDALKKLIDKNKLMEMVVGPEPDKQFMFDLIVIGGGSGGLAAAKEACDMGMNVACLDYVTPSPQGTTWGLGGTCVNVGCIPKKLMHTAAILGEHIHEAKNYGWMIEKEVTFDWNKLRQGVQDYIGSLNWNYRTQLRTKKVKYYNCLGKFVGPHTITATAKKGKSEELTARWFIMAMGGRPKLPDMPGMEHCVSSDDIFSLKYPPGKTVVVGASYVALECAGFLAGLGFEVVVMVRSILLRGFDQQCAELIGNYMAKDTNLTFKRPCVPLSVEKIMDGNPPVLKVTAQMMDESKSLIIEECNTVLVAVGRDPCTADMGLETVGVKINPSNGKVLHSSDEMTSCPYIYAIGDLLDGKPELTPIAIHAGRLLARRLAGKTRELTDYINIPTTVFTPLEYGSIGYCEEDAIKKFGENALEVFHTFYVPLEWQLPRKPKDSCYCKLICLKFEYMKVIGFHVTGPNAGEITQGFTLALKKGMTKSEFDNAIGIHPTSAELFTLLTVTKSSGKSPELGGC